MKIVAIACARDEIDIIEAFVRHTLAWVDRLVVLDNGSTDGTRDVLEGLRLEGLPLTVVDDPSLGKYLSKRITRLMHEHALAAGDVSWVLPLDVDEFIHVPAGGPLIPPDADAGRPLQLPWATYVPAEDDNPAENNPALRIRHRLVREESGLTKVVVPAALAAGKSSSITQGNHILAVDGQSVPGVEAQHACLAHFPIRTWGQFVAKIVIGHLQNEVVIERVPGHGFHQADYFEQLQSGPTALMQTFARTARRYSVALPGAAEPEIVLDPFPYRGGPLRLTPALDDHRRAWAPILSYVKGLSREYGLLRAALGPQGVVDFESQAAIVTRVLGHLSTLERILRSTLAALRDRDAQIVQHKQELAQLGLQASRDRDALIVQHEQEIVRHHQELAELRLQAQHQADIAEQRHQQELQSLHAHHAAELARIRQDYERSRSWRVGHTALGPLRLVRRAVQGCRRLRAS